MLNCCTIFPTPMSWFIKENQQPGYCGLKLPARGRQRQAVLLLPGQPRPARAVTQKLLKNKKPKGQTITTWKDSGSNIFFERGFWPPHLLEIEGSLPSHSLFTSPSSSLPSCLSGLDPQRQAYCSQRSVIPVGLALVMQGEPSTALEQNSDSIIV